jgi:CMP-N,N'-diacetyllegionaminic acid synthase
MILGAICARGGSKGIPRKNLRTLAGRPLIVHTIDCARSCRELQRVVVSTDDAEIADTARAHGAEVPFVRPGHLARDDSSKWDVFRHLVRAMEEMTGERVEILVDLDTGVPLRRPEDIAGCLQRLRDGDAEVVVTAYPPDRNPYFNMVEVGSDGYARICKPPASPIVGRQAAPPVFGLSPAVYAIRRDALWDHEHWSRARMEICVIPRERAVDIDTELDFRFVEYLMARQGEGH